MMKVDICWTWNKDDSMSVGGGAMNELSARDMRNIRSDAFGRNSLSSAVHYHLRYSRAVDPMAASRQDASFALGLALRDQLIDGIRQTEAQNVSRGVKRVHYISMEFLIGRLLENNLINLGLRNEAIEVMNSLGHQLDELISIEPDPALGNGGLGRLAACFIDSIATLGIAGYGYGINYEYGLFRQRLVAGHQHEEPDHWMAEGTPWQIERQNECVVVPLFGAIRKMSGGKGQDIDAWLDWQMVVGVPHDIPVVGYGGKTVNFLRLFSARSSDEFDIKIFNKGDYLKAIEQKIGSEKISKVLYPEDSTEAGKELRLIQEYFMVSCAIQDIIRRHIAQWRTIESLADRQCMQLNDTHPALTIAELMRLLLDEHEMGWNEAWKITTTCCSYTNHTLLPEALETWPLALLEKVLPRHVMIIREIDKRFRNLINATYPGDIRKHEHMPVIGRSEHDGIEIVRMANLSMIGSHSINGVAELHSELVKTKLAPDFYNLWPQKFNNKTNGVTPRRWLLQCNPDLASLISEHIGSGWVTDLDSLAELRKFADDSSFKEAVRRVKHANKIRLAQMLRERFGIAVNPYSIFDVQAKRVHEYKRQQLNALHIAHLYLGLRDGTINLEWPRTFIFGGKAAPGYFMAKRIIRFINAISERIAADRRIAEKLKVVYIPDYRVSVAEVLMPAADVSEQISTAGFEASGTGNMKFAMNGALTLGTLDGANIEIRDEVGDDNIFIFGMTVKEIEATRPNGAYDPSEIYLNTPAIKRVVDAVNSGEFAPEEPDLFEPLIYSLVAAGDYFRVLGDFDSYAKAQERIGKEYSDQDLWSKKAILNIAGSGKFSSDRTISEYAADIWKIPEFVERKARSRS
jgi:glycogen phosphorylase